MVLVPKKKNSALVSASATTVTLHYMKVFECYLIICHIAFFVRNLTPTEKEGKVQVTLWLIKGNRALEIGVLSNVLCLGICYNGTTAFL